MAAAVRLERAVHVSEWRAIRWILPPREPVNLAWRMFLEQIRKPEPEALGIGTGEAEVEVGGSHLSEKSLP